MEVARLPAPGGYVEIETEDLRVGGEAANTAIALRRWGREVELVGNPVGRGPDGETLARLLERAGFPEARDPSGRTPVCDIFVTPDGERTMFGRGFSTMEIDLEVEKIPYRRGEWFTAEPNMAAASRDATREAHEKGMKVYLMDFLREDDPIFPGSFWQSSTDWVSVRGDVDAQIAWLDAWVHRFGCFGIVSDGPRGFVAGSPEHPVRHYQPFHAPKVVDTTGAGDVFRAGMLYGFDTGRSVLQCLQFAAGAGALACGYLGATSGLPSVQEVKEFVAAQPEVAAQYAK